MKYVLFVCTQNAGRSQIADEILDTYDEVPVRSFVMTLANRKARAILKERTGAAAPS